MEKREFKVGDKVKIPKTKSKGCSLSSSHVIDRAKIRNQDYLFIIRIDECSELKDNTYVLDWRYDGINNIGGDHFAKSDLEHYEEKFVLPKCWFVLYDTREEFDLLNQFYDKGWAYLARKNTNGYHNNGDNQIHHNNWVGGSGSTKEKLLKKGYIQITFEQFQKYVLKEKEMERKIIGYKLNGKVEVEKVAYLLGCASTERDGMFFWETHFDGLTFLKAKELGILDLWFEPVYEEKFKVGDWVTIIKDSKGEGDNIRKGINYTFKIATIEQSFLYDDIWLISDKDNNNGVLSGYCRKATKEEIDKARTQTITQTIQMYSSNKGMFEIEVVDGRAYYRPENKELSKGWVASIIDVFDNKVHGLLEVPYKISAQIKEVKVGCMEGTRREDWVKVYDLLK